MHLVISIHFYLVNLPQEEQHRDEQRRDNEDNTDDNEDREENQEREDDEVCECVTKETWVLIACATF